MEKLKCNFGEVTRESAKAAVACGMTPEDFRRESGLTTITKLYAAIRGLYEKKAYAEKLIEGLKANRKKPVMAAPVEAMAEAEKTPVKGKKAAEKPVSVPVAEGPAQDITKPQNGAPENPAGVSVPKNEREIAKEAIKKGFVIAPDSIINCPELVRYCVSMNPDGAFVPQEALHTVIRLIECNRIREKEEQAAEMVKWLEENLPRGDVETREGDHVLQRTPIDLVIRGADSSMEPHNVRFVKHLLVIRKSTKYTEAIAMTRSSQISELLKKQA